jgi:hypothetical protein
MMATRNDEMRDRIATHPFPHGGVEVVGANYGYTLYSRRTDGPVARLRPTGQDKVQVLWWRGGAWTAPGDFGPVIMPLDQALDRLVAYLSGQGIAMRRSRISEIFIREGLKWRHDETWFGARVDLDFAKKTRTAKLTWRRHIELPAYANKLPDLV